MLISPLSDSSRVDLESPCSPSNPLFSLFSHLGQHTRHTPVLPFSNSYPPQHFTPCPARTSSKSTYWILKTGASLRSLLTPLLPSPSHTAYDGITFPKCKSDYVTLLVKASGGFSMAANRPQLFNSDDGIPSGLLAY